MNIQWERFSAGPEHRQLNFVVDGVHYASDGRIAIAVDTGEPSSDLSNMRQSAVKTITRLLQTVQSNSQWGNWPEYAICPHCEACNDSGVVKYPAGKCPDCDGKKEPCHECGGSGHVNCEYGHEHECPMCNNEYCLTCEGDGEVEEYIEDCDKCNNGYITVCGRNVANRYIRAISELEPPLKVGFVPGSTSEDPLFFTFGTTGRGAVMGLNKPHN